MNKADRNIQGREIFRFSQRNPPEYEDQKKDFWALAQRPGIKKKFSCPVKNPSGFPDDQETGRYPPGFLNTALIIVVVVIITAGVLVFHYIRKKRGAGPERRE